MEALITENQVQARLINNSLSNFRKMGKAKHTAEAIRHRIALLKEYWSKFHTTHVQIEIAASDEDQEKTPYFFDEVFTHTEEAFFSALDDLTEALTKVDGEASTSASSINTGGNREANQSVKLPRIDLPKFSGNFEDWEEFKDLFLDLVGNNNEIPEVRKLHYLKMSLTGEARLVLKNVKSSAANYKAAWLLLSERYSNQRVLINSQLSLLFDSPPIGIDVVKDLKQLRDDTRAALTGLKNLHLAVESWDEVIIFHLVRKLDEESLREWELRIGEELTYPSLSDWDMFIDVRIRTLQSLAASRAPLHNNRKSKQSPAKNLNAHLNAPENNCVACGANHALHQCNTFRSKSAAQRLSLARENRLCFNCLKSGHFPAKCLSTRSCMKCKGKHHTLLHYERKSPHKQGSSTARESTAPTNDNMDSEPSTSDARQQSHDASSSTAVNTHLGSARACYKKVVLATAWVKITAQNSRSAYIRALIDPGSEATFIRESVVQTLRAPRQPVQATISGIGAKVTAKVLSATNVLLEPCHGKGPVLPVHALVLKQLTAYQPTTLASFNQWSHLQDIEWADPLSAPKASIDLIIGADNYSAILSDGLRQGDRDAPVAQNTIFGWVLTGPIQSTSAHQARLQVHLGEICEDINDTLQKFWEIESHPVVSFLSEEDKRCEEHFVRTHSRKSDGTYIVRLPFKTEPPIGIGASRNIAVNFFCRLEKRLARDPEQAAAYHAFLEEYLQLGHMRELKEDEEQLTQRVFLSHHPVLRQDSSTTKLRVVFNASMITSNGRTLNDYLSVGPKLQADIVNIILRWRMQRFVFAADIAKMFRQIWIDPRDTHYQSIVWRSNPDETLKQYSLLTVTYGTAPAPFLANRVIKQIAVDEGTNFPLAVPVLNEQIYVDDALFGADDRVLALQLRHQVTEILKRGGFHLRKWASNCSQLLEDIPNDNHELASVRSLQEKEGLKMLGIFWSPVKDEFQFNFKPKKSLHAVTKRSVLSTIAQIFDPLGWISPVVIRAKIFIQKLWVAKLNWDEALPKDLQTQWEEFSAEFGQLQRVSIPRWVELGSCTLNCEIHGFADASQLAYAAVVYLRVKTIPDKTNLHLLISKTKVAPLKPLTIPRLELCAALILSRLIEAVRITLKLQSCPIYCWTDSAVALAWIHKHPSSLKTFAAHRVAEIQNRVPTACWRHVPTDGNPADCASRGVSVSGLNQHLLWWQGPAWLRRPQEEWPNAKPNPSEDVEAEIKVAITNLHAQTKTEWDLPVRISSWRKLLRVTAYVFRFVSRARSKPLEYCDAVISANEIFEARRFWISQVQHHYFNKEIKSLKKGEPLPRSSQLLRLNPFLDRDGTIRVGGRLRNAAFMNAQRFPIVLPAHRIAELIIGDCHENTLHGGVQLTLTVLRQVFWVINARRLVKKHIHACVTCVRSRASTANQQMADLPAVRVSPTRPFSHCGLDYAGPCLVRAYSGRGHKAHKAYIALFICLATRAIHLELVHDYSTANFIAAFERFVSRRGLPTEMYSDNGTNFQGANRELSKAFLKVSTDPSLRSRLAADCIKWHFIPPASPHFGGIWEAGVKSIKTHLRKVLGDRTPTAEEFNTLLCKIEACVNSRPIAPLTDDLESCEALTPGHFLVGGSLKAIPVPSVLEINENRLSRWQSVQQIVERFWKLWANYYLQTLQARSKWYKRNPNLRVGDFVLMKSTTLPPTKWELGRVTECYPGKDGLVRVVQVKTAQSLYVRAITQLCKLPIESSS